MNTWMKTFAFAAVGTVGAWLALRALTATPEGASIAEALDTWEGEGGNPEPDRSHGDGT